MGPLNALQGYLEYVMHHMSNTTNSTVPPISVLATMSRQKIFARDIAPFIQGMSVFAVEYPPNNIVTNQVHSITNTNTTTNTNTNTTNTNTNTTNTNTTLGRRSILQVPDWKQRLGIVEPLTSGLGYVQQYSALVAGAAKANPMLASYEDWLDGTQWPPLDRTAMGTCPSGVAVANILTGAFLSLKNQLIDPKPFPNFEHQRVNATFPTFHRYNGSIGGGGGDTPALSTISLASITSMLMDSFKYVMVSVFGIDIRYIIGFFTGGFTPGDDGLTFATAARSILRCDFQSVMDCQKKRANLFVGFLGVFIILTLMYMAIGSTATLILGGIGIGPLVLWYVYGYSPACIPMIPLCALQDVVATISWLVPIRIEWPRILQKIPNCAQDTNIPYQDCFLRCSDPPFRFNTWETTVAWILCDYDPHWAITHAMPWARDNNFNRLWFEIVDKYGVIQNEITGVTTPLDGMVEATRFCAVITCFNLTPYLFIGLFLVYAATAVVVLPFIIIQWLAEIFFSALAYIHTSQRGRKGEHM